MALYNNNFNNFSGGFGGVNNLNREGSFQLNQNQISPTFTNIYGVLSGLQSLVSSAGTLVDIAFFIKSFKEILFKIIIWLLSKIYYLLRYIITLRWLFDIYLKLGILSNSAINIMWKSYFSKIFFSIWAISLIIGIYFT